MNALPCILTNLAGINVSSGLSHQGSRYNLSRSIMYVWHEGKFSEFRQNLAISEKLRNGHSYLRRLVRGHSDLSNSDVTDDL